MFKERFSAELMRLLIDEAKAATGAEMLKELEKSKSKTVNSEKIDFMNDTMERFALNFMKAVDGADFTLKNIDSKKS